MLRKAIVTAAGLLFSVILLGCASTPADNTPTEAAPASAAATADAKPTVVQTTAQAREVASEEEVRRAYRECMRKMRRITGSRIPRNACQGSAGLYSSGYNQPTEGQGGAPGVPSE